MSDQERGVWYAPRQSVAPQPPPLDKRGDVSSLHKKKKNPGQGDVLPPGVVFGRGGGGLLFFFSAVLGGGGEYLEVRGKVAGKRGKVRCSSGKG